MENFIREQNIRLLQAKLAETTDPADRAKLLRLLATEEARPVIPDKAHVMGPKPGSHE